MQKNFKFGKYLNILGKKLRAGLFKKLGNYTAVARVVVISSTKVSKYVQICIRKNGIKATI